MATFTACLSPVVRYHRLARRYRTPPGFLMRPLLNGGTLGGQVDRFLLPEPNAELLAELTRLAVHIEDSLNRKRDTSVLLARYAELCGNRVEPVHFVAYYGSMTTEQFVRGTLVPQPVQDPTVTDDELEDLIRRLVAPEYPEDHHYGYWRRILEVNIPHPSIDSVFTEHDGASPSELLRKAREYKPICL